MNFPFSTPAPTPFLVGVWWLEYLMVVVAPLVAAAVAGLAARLVGDPPGGAAGIHAEHDYFFGARYCGSYGGAHLD